MGPLAPFTPMRSCTPAATKPFSTDEALNLTSFKLSESRGLEPQSDDSVFEDEADDLIDMSVRILPGVRSLINSYLKISTPSPLLVLKHTVMDA